MSIVLVFKGKNVTDSTLYHLNFQLKLFDRINLWITQIVKIVMIIVYE